jgi:hypothetical protein
MRRFCRANKQTAGLQPCKTVGGVWRGNEATRNDLATRNPEPPTGGEAHTVLLCAVGAYFIILLQLFVQILFSDIYLQFFIKKFTTTIDKIISIFINPHLLSSNGIDSSSVLSILKITGRNPSLQLHIATPGFSIQSL